jgi:hypothetical protein
MPRIRPVWTKIAAVRQEVLWQTYLTVPPRGVVEADLGSDG